MRPTPQALIGATDWHDGQFAHGAHAEIAWMSSPWFANGVTRTSRGQSNSVMNDPMLTSIVRRSITVSPNNQYDLKRDSNQPEREVRP
jgi:hypothetical protein